MKNERNRMDVNLVEAEFNFSMSCFEFHDFIKNNIVLLKAAKSDKKYKFRHNK